MNVVKFCLKGRKEKGFFFFLCEYGNCSEFEVVYSNVGSVLNFSKEWFRD